MPGKLPIARVRAAKDAPRFYEREKQRFTKQQAPLQAQRPSRPDAPDSGGDEMERSHRDA
jgi:hypothetical protein